MHRIMLAATLCLLASPALALCRNAPDSSDTGYVDNATDRTLCLQQELSMTTDALRQQAEIDAALAALQDQIQKQQQQLDTQLTKRFDDWSKF